MGRCAWKSGNKSVLHNFRRRIVVKAHRKRQRNRDLPISPPRTPPPFISFLSPTRFVLSGIYPLFQTTSNIFFIVYNLMLLKDWIKKDIIFFKLLKIKKRARYEYEEEECAASNTCRPPYTGHVPRQHVIQMAVRSTPTLTAILVDPFFFTDLRRSIKLLHLLILLIKIYF